MSRHTKLFALLALIPLAGCDAYAGLYADIPPYVPRDATTDAPPDLGNHEEMGAKDEDANDVGEAPLSEPMNVTTTSVDGGVRVEWDVVEDATQYELRIDGGDWASVGTRNDYLDTDAPAPTLGGALEATASEGTSRPHVQLSAMSTVEALDGTERTYEVRARDATRTSAPSVAETGKRLAGAVVYSWERDDSGTFNVLPDASGLEYEDTQASPLGTPHTYRVTAVLQGEDARVVSTSVEGWRLAVRDIASGLLSTCALLTDGAVKCWGDNENGKLGYGDETPRGQNAGGMPTPNLNVGERAKSIHVGDGSFCIIDTADQLRCWGSGSKGKMGQGNSENIGDNPNEFPLPTLDIGGQAIKVAGGGAAMCALIEGGELVCWGGNDFGVLGQDKSTTPSIGSNPGEMPPPPVTLQASVVDFDMGVSHVCASLSNGDVACWGGISAYELEYLGVYPPPLNTVGDETGEMPPSATDIVSNPSFISVGSLQTCAVDQASNILCWGYNSSGQHGLGDSELVRPRSAVEASNYPMTVVDLTKFTQHYIRNASAPRTTPEKLQDIRSNAGSTCVLYDNGGLMCWGDLSSPLFEGPALSPQYLPILGVIHKMGKASSTAGHLCAIDDQGEALCWGNDSDGQLGYEGRVVDLSTERARIKLW